MTQFLTDGNSYPGGPAYFPVTTHHACPYCGRDTRPYNAQLSAVLDILTLLQAVTCDLRQAVEALALEQEGRP